MPHHHTTHHDATRDNTAPAHTNQHHAAPGRSPAPLTRRPILPTRRQASPVGAGLSLGHLTGPLIGLVSTWAAHYTSQAAARRNLPRTGLLDLFLPHTCAGCGAGGTRLCPTCHHALRTPPGRVYPRLDTLVPVWALGDYAGPRRALILNMKEHGRHDTYPVLGAVLAAGVEYLAARGDLPEGDELVVVPAPTRQASARARGGDPVHAICQASGLHTEPVVFFDRGAKDSVGLSMAARSDNAHAHVRVRHLPPLGEKRVLLVDDIVTTGATLQATAYALHARGVRVCGALTLCAA